MKLSIKKCCACLDTPPGQERTAPIGLTSETLAEAEPKPKKPQNSRPAETQSRKKSCLKAPLRQLFADYFSRGREAAATD